VRALIEMADAATFAGVVGVVGVTADEIVAAAAHCHGEPGEMSRLAQVVDLMDNIVRLAGFGLSADESEWGLPGEKLTALGIDHDQAQQVKSEALVQLKFIEDAQRGG
jgi:hypothetical protein